MSDRNFMLRPGIRRLLGLDVARKEIIVRDLEDELQLHLELRAEQLEQRGMSREAAMAEARRRYGHLQEATQEIHRHARRREKRMQWRISLDSFAQDARFSLRSLRRAKAWTAVAVLTLALGIGANTAVFSVVNDLLLDPLKYPERDRLVMISRLNTQSSFEIMPTMEQFSVWRGAKSLSGLEGVVSEDLTMIAENRDPSTVHVSRISPTFTRFSGARILHGRTIQAGDTLASAVPVVVLSERLWRNTFGGMPDVIGKTLKLDDKSRTIVGVMEDGVRVTSFSSDRTDLWMPLPAKGFFGGPLVARLAPGATIPAAQQELQAIAKALAGRDGTVGGAEFDVKLRTPGSLANFRSSLLLLSGAVALLLLIACANVAHLLLARGAAREREMSIRAALGAGRGRIVRQLLTESMMLAIVGCVAGLGVGTIALRGIVAFRSERLSNLANVQLESRVVLVTIGLSLLSGLLFGLIASYGGRATRSFDALRASLASTSDRRRHRIRSLLVVTENALSVVLLVGAMLLIRTVANLQDINPGFDAKDLYAMSVALPDSRYSSPAARTAYADRLLSDVRGLPGVAEATISSYMPTRTGIVIGDWIAEGAPTPTKPAEPTFSATNHVAPEYFGLMRIKLLSGRTFDAASSNNHEVIVNRSLATRVWGQDSPIGKRMRSSGDRSSTGTPTWNVVVGVAPDAAMLSLQDQEKNPAIYFPSPSAPEDHFTLVVRMKPGQLPHQPLRKVSLGIDPLMSPPAVVNVSEQLLQSVSSQRFMMVLLTVFASLAVVLSATGLYGVIAYMVSQSTREIGVRVALGAARRDVIRLVMRQGVLLSIGGLGVGIAASLWGARLLKHTLYGVTANDPLSYVAGSVVLVSLAVAACIAPTRRALRIDPMVAMRSE